MKIMRNPKISAIIILIVTAFYSLVFIATSEHLEFVRMLEHSHTLKSVFWVVWSDFLLQGNLKYIGYSYIVLATAIIILSFTKKRDYDEYQAKIFEKGMLIAGIVMVCLFPLALLLVLSDPNYSIATLMLLVVAHWSSVLIADLIYIIKWSKS